MASAQSASNPRSPAVTRRTVLRSAAALSTGTLLSTIVDRRASAATVITKDPFQLGVAAGDPWSDALMLWTRLVRDPLDAASLPDQDVTVTYELATDAKFSKIVRRDGVNAPHLLNHSVHVDLRGLDPSTEYHYRFRCGTYVSPAGRARTAAAPGTTPSSLKFAIANCQDFQNGYWPAYSAMADEDLDFVLHLGDYIYEYDPKSTYPDRLHTTPKTKGLDQLRTLTDYRNRHAQYKLDPALQAAHANAAWIPVWDDHEVENNYANLADDQDDTGARHQSRTQFTTERANGYQAYYENMPIRVKETRHSPNLKLYRQFDFGLLLRLCVLDTRQYRSDQPGNYAHDLGPMKAGTKNGQGTLTGASQQTWLEHKLATSPTAWNAIGQQVMMSRTRLTARAGHPSYYADLDAWDGYAPFRNRLLTYVHDHAVRNPVVLSGDVHSTWFNDLPLDPAEDGSKVVAAEFVSTSVSSSFEAGEAATLAAHLKDWNPRTHYFNGTRHGYLRVAVTPGLWTTEERTVDSIAHRSSPVSTTASYVVEDGRAGLQKA